MLSFTPVVQKAGKVSTTDRMAVTVFAKPFIKVGWNPSKVLTAVTKWLKNARLTLAKNKT